MKWLPSKRAFALGTLAVIGALLIRKYGMSYISAVIVISVIIISLSISVVFDKLKIK